MKYKVFAFLSVLVFSLLFVPSLPADNVVLANENTCQVVASECGLYSSASFENPLLDDEEKEVRVKHGQILKVLSDEQDGFIKVEYVGVDNAFIYARYVTFNVLEQDTYPVFNASIAVESAEVFNLDGSPASIQLAKGKELYLYQGYKKGVEKTAVCFVQDDGRLFYGLVNTKDLEPYGVNAALITGLLVAASCITIILLLVFMKKNKKIKK